MRWASADAPRDAPGRIHYQHLSGTRSVCATCGERESSARPERVRGRGEGGEGFGKKKTLLCAFEWRSVWNINARGVCRCRICTNVITPSEESWVHSYYHTFLVVKQPQALRRASYFNVPRPQLNQVAQKTLMAVENIPSNLNLTKSRNRK